jgi:ribosomal protein S18 acetylase RimI-like enzyme
MATEVRRIEGSEAANLSRLAKTLFAAALGHSLRRDDLEAHLEAHLSIAAIRLALDRDVILGAVAEGRLIGFIQFGALTHPSVGPERAREIRRLYVTPEFQRRGVGSMLTHAALSHPILAGAEAILLDVWKRNKAAQGLYRKFEFRVVGSKPFTFASGRRGDDDLIMARKRRAVLSSVSGATSRRDYRRSDDVAALEIAMRRRDVVECISAARTDVQNALANGVEQVGDARLEDVVHAIENASDVTADVEQQRCLGTGWRARVRGAQRKSPRLGETRAEWENPRRNTRRTANLYHKGRRRAQSIRNR